MSEEWEARPAMDRGKSQQLRTGDHFVTDLVTQGGLQQVGINASGNREYRTTAKLFVTLTLSICALLQEQADAGQRDYSASERQQLLEKMETTQQIVLRRLSKEGSHETSDPPEPPLLLPQNARRGELEEGNSLKSRVEEALSHCARLTKEADEEQRDYTPRELTLISHWLTLACEVLRPDPLIWII